MLKLTKIKLHYRFSHVTFALMASLFTGALTHAQTEPVVAEPFHEQKISVSININRIARGTVDIIADERPERDCLINRESLLQILRDNKILNVEAESRLTLALSSQLHPRDTNDEDNSKRRYIRASLLRLHGLAVKYDLSQLTIEVEIPADMLPEQIIDFGPGSATPPLGQRIWGPAPFSGFSNFRANKTFDTLEPGRQTSDRPLRVFLENVQNMNGFYLESYFNYEEFTRSPLNRSDIRISKDFESLATRATAGDFDLPFVGFQHSLPFGGLLYRKNYEITPGVSVSPVSRFSFFLSTPSRVAVYVNEKLLREISMPAGHHHLNNLPTEPGINNIRLQITDADGRVSQLFFPFVYDIELLDQGLTDYSYAVGSGRTFDGGRTMYALADPAVSAYHRVGLLQNLTLGLNYQGDHRQRLLGAETVIGTAVGLFAVDVAASSLVVYGSSGAAQIRYRSTQSAAKIFRLSLQEIGRNFAALGTLIPSNLYSTTASADLSYTVADLATFSIGTTYGFSRDHIGDSVTNFASVSRYFKNRINAVLQLTQTRDPIARSDTRGYLMIQWSDATSETQVFGSEDTRLHDTRLDVAYVPQIGRQSGNLGASAGALYNSGVREAHSGLSLIDPHGEFSVDEQVVTPTPDNGSVTQYLTRFQAAGAVAYTGHGIGFSRPIYDSFALIRPEGKLREQAIEINPVNNNPQAIAQNSRPGILSNIRAYTVQSVHLQTSDPLASAMMPEDHVYIRPTYRSGVEVPLKPESSVMLSGILLTDDPQQPVLGLLTGSLEALSPVEGAPKTLYFFTNEEGRFVAESVPPGRYRLQLDAYDGSLEVAVPESAFGPTDIGTLHFNFPKKAL